MNYTYIQMKTLKMGKTKRTKRIKIINIRAEVNKIKIKKIADVNKASGYFFRGRSTTHYRVPAGLNSPAVTLI